MFSKNLIHAGRFRSALVAMFTASTSLSVQACRVSGGGATDPEVREAGTGAGGTVPAVGSSGQGGYADSRVSLINAPCGADSGLEAFLAAARALHLENKLVKLPAVDWKVTAGNQPKSFCKLMADSGARLALVYMIPANCAACPGLLLKDAGALPPGASDTLVVAVVSGYGGDTGSVAQQLAAENSKLLVVQDEAGKLLDQLKSRTGPEVAPRFLLHSSGYGAFANTSGPAMDGLTADFVKLAGTENSTTRP